MSKHRNKHSRRDAAHDAPAAPPAPERTNDTDEQLVPGWLALLVLVLLFAVAALGGFTVRGMILDRNAPTPQDVAVVEWQRKVDADPTDPDSLLGLGYAYQQGGQYADALAIYESVLRMDQDNVGALYNRATALTALGRYDEAEAAYWSVLGVVPDHVLAAKALGDYYVDSERYTSALEALEPVIAARPHFADLQYLAGHASEMLGRDGDARAYYRAALTYAPDLLEARDGLARLEADE